MPIGQFGVDGCHLDGGRAQCGLGDHQGGRQGGGTGVLWSVGAGVCFTNSWKSITITFVTSIDIET